MFDSKYANVKYIETDNIVLLTWKERAVLEQYRDPATYALKLLETYEFSNLVVDARHGFEDDRRDVEWGFQFLLPSISKTTCKYLVFILNELCAIEGEMDMWTLKALKYFEVRRVTSYDAAINAVRA